MTTVLQTERLLLRLWEPKDAQPYYDINQDPLVIEHLPGPLTHEQVADFMARMNKQYHEKRYTLWAVELKKTGELIGFIGLNYTDWPAHFTPAVEIGWRLGSQHWGHGYATEGAKACLRYAFDVLQLPEIVSFTVPANVRSIAVMERIGMQRDAGDDFAHPRLAPEHRLSKHVLYRMSKKSV